MHCDASREDAAFWCTSGKSPLVILIKIVEKEINEIAQRISPFAYMTMEVNLQAGCGCRGLGARSGLPKCTDPRLADY
jgi:hypothetical protein